MSYKKIDLKFNGYWRETTISELPDQSGIYCVYTCIYNSEENTVLINKLLYIGESGNVKERIESHEKWKDWREYLDSNQQICISCATISSSIRNRAEAALIYKHQPPVNIEYLESFPFDETKISTTEKNESLFSSFIVERDD